MSKPHPNLNRTAPALPRSVARLSKQPAGKGGATGRVPAGVVLMEVSTEVCNPVGGIYQVIRSKASHLTDRWGKRYAVVGPWAPGRSNLEFDERRPRGWLKELSTALAVQGVVLHYGEWLVQGRPRALLIETQFGVEHLNKLKEQLWREHRVATDSHEPLVGQTVAFAEGVRLLIREVHRIWAGAAPGRRLLAHFHEWLGGLALPLLKSDGVPLASVFTTHATILGRYLAGSGALSSLTDPTIDTDTEARRLGIYAQHTIERACATCCDTFTTVSSTTAEECRIMLGRTPEVVLPNGLNIARFSVGHEFQTLHAVFRERIDQFVMGQFFPSYPIDLDRTLYFFTSGRYEPHNKGFDLCLDACAKLNHALRSQNSPKTIVLFIVTKRETRSLLPESLHMRGVLGELREVCDRIAADLGNKLFHLTASGSHVSLDQLVEEYWSLRLRRTQAALRTDHDPPLMTHALPEHGGDEVLDRIRACGLANREADRVKVVYSPDFITPTNPLWGMEYEQFVRGCHLGLFPSAYEPWGYTPLECMALGVPAVSSDLAGFGRYAAEVVGDALGWSPWVLARRGRSMEQAADMLASRLMEFCRLERRDRIDLRNRVEARSWSFDWGGLIGAYHKAHADALERSAAQAVSS